MSPGTLVFIPGRGVTVAGWHFQLLGDEHYADINAKPALRAQLLAALGHIANVHHLDLDPESVVPAPPRILKRWREQDLASERAAANTITKAKAKP